MLKKILGVLSAIFLIVFLGLLIATGAGGAMPPPGPPPEPPPLLPPGGLISESSNLPSGFYPYAGYHYSGYVVEIDYPSRTFLYDSGGQVVSVRTDADDIFFRIEKVHGREEVCAFEDLKINQLVWLKGVEIKPGWVVLKIQLSDWIK